VFDRPGGGSVGGVVAAVVLVALEAPGSAAATFAGLPILPNAVDVVRHASKTMPGVEYDVREQYPARETIRLLVDAMAKAGWKLAEVGGFKASWPRSSNLPTPSPPKRALPTHFWRGRWLGENGQEAEFRLTYTCPMEESGMHSVWVHVGGDVHGPQEAARRRAARSRILAECEAGKTVSPECEK
jgi:hypothetical protein